MTLITSFIKSNIEYILIIYLFGVKNIIIFFYKLSQIKTRFKRIKIIYNTKRGGSNFEPVLRVFFCSRKSME